MNANAGNPVQMGTMLLAMVANECDLHRSREAELARFLGDTLARIRGCQSNADIFKQLLVGCNAVICSLDGSAAWHADAVDTASAFFDGVNRAFVDNGEHGFRKARFGDPLTTDMVADVTSPTSAVSMSRDPSTSLERLVSLSRDGDWEVRAGVASNPATPEALLRKLAVDRDEGVRSYTARNANTPADVLDTLSHDSSEYVRDFLAQNPSLPLPLMRRLASDPHWRPRSGVAENPSSPIELLRMLSMDPDERVRSLARQNLLGRR